MGKPTVSILGVCVSRDIFRVARPTEYTLEQCLTTINPMSLMFSPPTDGFRLTPEMLDETQGETPFKRRILCKDCNKEVMAFLGEKKSDYLLLSIADSRLRIITFKRNNATLSNNDSFKRALGVFKKMWGSETETKRYYDFSKEDWKNCIDTFINQILCIYKPEEIILHEAYGVLDYISKANKSEKYKDLDVVRKYNLHLKWLNDIIKTKLPDCHVIGFPNYVIGSELHKWGLHPLHYVDLYYEYAGKALDVITSAPPPHTHTHTHTQVRAREQEALKELMDTYSEKFLELRKRCSECSISEIKRGGVQIVFTKVGKAELVPLSEKKLKPADVEVKTAFTLISNGTEKAHLLGLENTTNKFPMNIGYSAVGIVTSVGSAVRSVKQGDRVFVEYGGHSSVIVKDVHNVVKIPDNVSFEEAVFAKIASYPLAAVRRARLEIGESVVIVGLGMLGLFGVQFARIGGGLPVIAIGNRDIRREKAASYGADYVFSPDEPDLSEKIYSITDERTVIHGANVVIETSGTESGLLSSLKFTAKNARVMLNGCQRVMTQPVDFYKYVHTRGVSIIGVHGQTRPSVNSYPGNWTSKRELATVLQYIANKRLDSKSMISEIVSPKSAGEVYDRLLNDRDFPMGVIFDWTKI